MSLVIDYIYTVGIVGVVVAVATDRQPYHRMGAVSAIGAIVILFAIAGGLIQ